jgi:Flp pilus assembly protein TadB
MGEALWVGIIIVAALGLACLGFYIMRKFYRKL